MKAIEMFAGIGGFRIGLESAGIDVVWANDIDPKASVIYQDHFGNGSIVCGDVRDAKDSIPGHDLLTAGFPCQPFSAAGKKMGIHDQVRGTLFAEIVEVLERLRPNYFILENVKRLLTMESGRHFRTILLALTEAGYFVEWRLLNAKNFGLAQNRERVFLVGRRARGDLLERDPMKFAARESVIFLKGELSDGGTLFPLSALSELMIPIAASQSFGTAGFAWYDKAYSSTPIFFPTQKPPKTLRDVLQEDADPFFDFTESTNGWVKNNTEVNSFINGVEILSNQEGGRRMGYTIFGTGGLAPTLTATASRHYERYRIRDRYRRLTNVEYARLQGFQDDWCKAVTVYDQYALFGNAVPPVMVEWISGRLLERCKPGVEGKPDGGHQATAAAARS